MRLFYVALLKFSFCYCPLEFLREGRELRHVDGFDHAEQVYQLDFSLATALLQVSQLVDQASENRQISGRFSRQNIDVDKNIPGDHQLSEFEDRFTDVRG